MKALRHPLARDILDGLRSQPARVGLSFFAITIGILALTTLLAVLEGLNARARALVEDLGVQVLALLAPPGSSDRDEGASLTTRHYIVLRDNLPDCIVAPVRSYPFPFEGLSGTVTVIPTDEGLDRIRQWPLLEGRFIDRTDVRLAERHIVISRTLARRMNWAPGSIVTVNGTALTVVGVIDVGSGAADAQAGDARLAAGDLSVFVPWSLTESWAERAGGGASLDAIFIRAPASADLDTVQRRAAALLSAPDLALGDASWVSPETLIAGIRKLQRTLSWSLGGIVALCMLLGGTTLMSLMVANVRDRIAEIGLRRALGARARDVAALFVVESGVITAAGALAGSILAVLLISLAGTVFPTPLKITGWTLILPFLISILTGVVFSYWPASVAARISPAEALRNE